MFSFGMQSTGLPSTDDIIFIGGSETLNSDVVTSSMESRQQNNYPVIQQFLGYFQSFLQQVIPTRATSTKVT